MRRCRAALAAAALSLALLSACGGSDTPEAGATESAGNPGSPSSTGTTGEPSEEATTQSPAETPTETPAESAGATPTGAEQAYCDAVREAQQELTGGGAGSTADVDQISRSLDDIIAVAPADIRPQWQLIADAVDDVRAATASAGIDLADLSDPQALAEQLAGLSPKERREFTRSLRGLDTSELPQANQEIATQVQEVCDLSLTPEAVPTP